MPKLRSKVIGLTGLDVDLQAVVLLSRRWDIKKCLYYDVAFANRFAGVVHRTWCIFYHLLSIICLPLGFAKCLVNSLWNPLSDSNETE